MDTSRTPVMIYHSNKRKEMSTTCGTLECHSIAVAKSKVSQTPLCNECALKVMRQSGPNALVTLPKAVFPWKKPATGICENCGVQYNEYLIGLTGDCPKCRKNLPEYHEK